MISKCPSIIGRLAMIIVNLVPKILLTYPDINEDSVPPIANIPGSQPNISLVIHTL